MNILKKCLPDIVAVVLFVAISLAYFIMPLTQHKVLFQNDSAAGMGLGHEMEQYEATHNGDVTRWTNSAFSGMPTYQIAPSYKSESGLGQLLNAYHLWLPDYAYFLFIYLIGFYILLRVFDFRQSLAVLGSILWAFSSYFLIIIAAGHYWKVLALAYLPPMIAGIVLSYKGKYLWGFVVTALFTAFEVSANHVQMTYYYLFIVLLMVIAFFVKAILQKQISRFLKASGVCLIAALIGLSINISNLYHTWEYAKSSMRGKSELVKKNTANQTANGLDRDYITQWSYGIDETMTLLIPNAKGGASVPLSQSKTAMKEANPEVEQMLPGIYNGITQYFGTQPGTSGPVYVGAFVLFLFFLSLFIVKGPFKWALVVATILSVLLSWGRNFMWLTNVFLDYVPMYSKFRTVASILVIAEFTIPLLAMLGLKKIIDEPDLLKRKKPFVVISLILTAGVALLIAVAPGLMSPSDFNASDQQTFRYLQGIDGMTPQIMSMITGSVASMRAALVSSDAWRSVFIILIGFALILLYSYKKLKAQYLIGAIAILCLVDLWQVDKRYLNDGMFVNKSVSLSAPQMTQADEQILRDKSLDYRVLNLSTNTFNENQTSYYHKSIGGYHPAKLQRYQNMIDQYIVPEIGKFGQAISIAGGDMTKMPGDSILPVLNMLNTKYIIVPLQNNQTIAIQNPYAMGNAWYISNIKYVDTPNEEIAQVGKLNLHTSAVADKKFASVLGNGGTVVSDASVKLDSYEPNQLEYTAQSKNGGIIAFSEIWYPEWTATVDGKPVDVGRVNYVLRAIKVAPGQHKIVLSFFPKSVTITETIAYISFAILLLSIVLVIALEIRKEKKKKIQKLATA